MNTQLVPEIRFKEFEGEWTPGKAGAYFVNRSEKGNDDLPVLSVIQTSTRIVRRNSQDRDFENAAKASSNKQVHRGDLAYNTMRMWQGAVAIADERGMVSAAYTVLQPKSETSSEFFNYLFCTPPSLYKLWAYSYGITNDRLRLYFKDFAVIPFRVPTLPEQQKIATFLALVDRRLAAARRRVQLLEEWKRGAVEIIFDKPKTKNWRPYTLEKIAKLKMGFTPSTSDSAFWDGDIPWLSIADIKEQKYVVNTKRTITELGTRSKPILPKGTLVMSFKLSVGKLAVLGRDMYTNEAICSFNWTKQLNQDFVYYYLQQLNIISFGSQAAKGITLNKQSLNSIVVKLPLMKEQTRIATILTTIDSRISAAQQEAAGWEQWKRGLLQKMMI